MCCGQPARRLDDVDARWLYARYLAGDGKRLLCAMFRIGTPEYERIVAPGGYVAQQYAARQRREAVAP